jgi:gas vesicle protein
MTSNDPDQIRDEIERTRADLSQNVNTLADTANPAHAAKRQADKVKGAVFGAKDRVMGSVGDAGSGIGSAQSTVSDAVTDAPRQLRTRTAGNPLAAGLIAFGVGWLAASLLPASQAEQQAATKVKDAAAPMVTDAAKQVADHLKEPAQQAVESVKDTATDAATTVKDEGSSAAGDVKNQVQDAKATVQNQ